MRRALESKAFIQAWPLCLGLVACGPFPIEYETKHLRIGTNLDYPLCEGNLASYERIIATVQDDLGVHSDRTVDVYIWDAESWDAERVGDGVCGPEIKYVTGCYKSTSSTILTSTISLRHEIGHAAIANPSLEGLFGEGAAEMYSGATSRFGSTAPTQNIGVAREALDTGTAIHFVRWLRERWGGHKLGELFESGGSKLDIFESIYGMSLAEAEALYFKDAPPAYAPLHHCDAPELLPDLAANSWRTDVEIDCSASDTFSGPGGLFVHRSLVIETAGRYSITTDGGWLDIYRCTQGAVDELPTAEELLAEDVPPDYGGFPDPAFRYFTGQQIHDVELKRGRYDVSVGIEGHEPGSAMVLVWPSIASQPGTP